MPYDAETVCLWPARGFIHKYLLYKLGTAQRGITLIEALLALLMLALSVLRLAQAEARMLEETRTPHSRASIQQVSLQQLRGTIARQANAN
jgi:Tfp pilus assembly protein PilV